MHAQSERKKCALVEDRQGAVMVIGLFMAIFLIGAMWTIIGTGEAIMVRDHAIEAADHAAFSAATVHARGMNYISALNLIMFALTAIYVAICIVADLVLLLASLGGWSKNTGPFGGIISFFGGSPSASCGPSGSVGILIPEITAIAEKACELGHTIATAAQKYNDYLLKPAFGGISILQDVVQVGMPIAAEAGAVTVASQYTPTYVGIVLSPSLVPGVSKSDKKIGLPLKSTTYDFLCKLTFAKVKDAIDHMSFVPGLVKKLIHWVIDDVQDEIMSLSPQDNPGTFSIPFGGDPGGIGCKGGHPWGDKGLPLVADGAENGSDYLQMWGLIVNARDKELGGSEQRVGMSKNKGAVGVLEPPKKRYYYSQAEYYFDCTMKWAEAGTDCNEKDLKQASFQMNWRARLRRVHAPSFGNKFVGLTSEFVISGNLNNFIAGQVGNNKLAQKMASAITWSRNNDDAPDLAGAKEGDMDGPLNFLNGGDKPIH
ncbi:MAG TPA: hypothetical protein VNO21_14305 [Polyangiaceae bacterium]|nr:hypothetical protein [Polyangiaceae bacterium]